MNRLNQSYSLPVFSLLILLLSTTVSAHSFSVLLTGPFSGIDAQTGLSMQQGFLVATAERDAHPDETADGHLGGLDVHLQNFDTAKLTNSTAKTLDQKEHKIDIIIVQLENHMAKNLIQYAKSKNAVVITPADLPFEGSPGLANSANRFVSAFVQRFSIEPDRFAAQGYQLARRIDEAVRPFDSAKNTADLKQRLRKTQSGIKW
ncbi:MAG: hypothetical protein KAI17_23940 [Thiotrichaceae bacterium]|nr:hypothetical protein [Thiotrichaceae bacterium]